MKIFTYTILITGILYFFASCSSKNEGKKAIHTIKNKIITVDGNVSDWQSISPFTVEEKDHLWIGQGMEAYMWSGKEDLSFSWKTAWNDSRIFFLFQVTDDILSNFSYEYTWLNDCIEIHIDPENRGGERVRGINADNTLKDRLGKQLFGYEMHFLPDQPPRIVVDDTRSLYYTDTTQNEYFEKNWKGEAVTRYTDNGYIMEIGFTIPDSKLKSGKIIGMDIAICDDDGKSRESLLLWSGYKGEFWIRMDNFHKMRLQ